MDVFRKIYSEDEGKSIRVERVSLPNPIKTVSSTSIDTKPIRNWINNVPVQPSSESDPDSKTNNINKNDNKGDNITKDGREPMICCCDICSKKTKVTTPEHLCLSGLSFKNGSVVDFSNAEVLGLPNDKRTGIPPNTITETRLVNLTVIEDSSSIKTPILNTFITGQTETDGRGPFIAVRWTLKLNNMYTIEVNCTVINEETGEFNNLLCYAACSSYKDRVKVIPNVDNQQKVSVLPYALKGATIAILEEGSSVALTLCGNDDKSLKWWYTVQVKGTGSISKIEHLNNSQV